MTNLSSSVAMANLFMLQDIRLSNIIVKGDLIINRSEEIITRSKTKLSIFILRNR